MERNGLIRRGTSAKLDHSSRHEKVFAKVGMRNSQKCWNTMDLTSPCPNFPGNNGTQWNTSIQWNAMQHTGTQWIGDRPLNSESHVELCMSVTLLCCSRRVEYRAVSSRKTVASAELAFPWPSTNIIGPFHSVLILWGGKCYRDGNMQWNAMNRRSSADRCPWHKVYRLDRWWKFAKDEVNNSHFTLNFVQLWPHPPITSQATMERNDNETQWMTVTTIMERNGMGRMLGAFET